MRYLRFILLVCLTTICSAFLWRPFLTLVSEKSCSYLSKTPKEIISDIPYVPDSAKDEASSNRNLRQILNTQISPVIKKCLPYEKLAQMGLIILFSAALAKAAKFRINLHHIWPIKKLFFAPPAWLGLITGWLLGICVNMPKLSEISFINFSALFLPLFLFILSNRHAPRQKVDIQNYEIGMLFDRLTALFEKRDQVSLEDIKPIYTDLKAWLAKKEAIEKDTLSVELTSAKKMAEQIVYKLSTTIEKNSCGLRIGIVGPYGCGKSSIINLILHYLNQKNFQKPKLIISSINVWGCTSSSSAQDHIIDSILKEMDYHFDASSFSRIGKEWKNFIQGGSAGKLKFLSYFIDSRNFDQRLRDIAALFKKLNYHLLVVIEDIDRNAEQNYCPKQIQALLEQLKKWLDCSMLIAGQENSIDFTRLCDYEISPPKLSVYTLKKIIWVMARYHIPTAFNNWHYPLDLIPWSLLYGSDTSNNSLGNIIAHNDIFSLKDLLSLIDNLRVFKSFLQRLDEGWAILKDEICYFDFFLITLLRTALPESFSLIHMNHELLQSIAQSPEDAFSEDIVSLKTKLADHQKQLGYKNVSFSKILVLLFGKGICQTLQISDHLNLSSWPNIKTQRVSSESFPTDYWNRAYLENLSQHEVEDKKIVQAHQEWISDPNNCDLILLLRNEIIDFKWAQLSLELPLNLQQTLSLTQSILLDRTDQKNDPITKAFVISIDKKIKSALMVLHSRAHEFITQEPEFFLKWLIQTFEKLCDKNLNTSILFIQKWAFNEEGFLNLLTKQKVEPLKVKIKEILKQKIKNASQVQTQLINDLLNEIKD